MFNRKEWKKAWNKKNADKCKEYARKSRLKHKEQRKLDHKLWVEKNKEKVKAYHHRYNPIWYQKNKEEHDAKAKTWRQNPENKKKAIKYTQKYVQKNKEKVYSYGRQYNKTLIGRFRTTKGNANARGYEFLLSFEEFSKIILSSCNYCGEKKERIGIDRIDNSIGYTKENSAPCCKICNFMKKNYPLNDFLSHIKKIYEFQERYDKN